jgi:la-related protein 1
LKVNSSILPPPPERDQESWPTPENAVVEDRKKAPVKGEKTESERKENPSGRAHGKQEWINVPITPNVIFNTPLPNTASSRRGGRGGGRGGAQNSGRGNGVSVNGAGNPDKDASTAGLTNGDNSKRGRPDASSTRDASPKDPRAASASSSAPKDTNGEKTSRPTAVPEAETASRRSSVMTEQTSGPQAANQSNGFTRQYPINRPNKARRGDFVPQADRRKDSDQASPTKEAPGSHDRRTSTATQTDGKYNKRLSQLQRAAPAYL